MISTQQLLDALRKNPPLYFDLVRRIHQEPCMVVSPWTQTIDLEEHEIWCRVDPLDRLVAVVRRKSPSSGWVAEAIFEPVGHISAEPMFREEIQPGYDISHAKAWCDAILGTSGWDILDAVSQVASPWIRAGNYWKREILLGMVRGRGVPSYIALVRQSESGWGWAILTPNGEGIQISGGTLAQEAAFAEADQALVRLGWELT